MIAIESWKPMHERVIAIQMQIRIAIQNHQVLFLKHKLFPYDMELKSRITGIQNLIVAMSKAQTQLLSQCRKDGTSLRGLNQAKSQLWWNSAKHIPLYKKQSPSSKQEETKRIATWKRRGASTKRLLLRGGNMKNGYLKKKMVLDSSKIKVLVNNDESLLKGGKLHSVLKSKSERGEEDEKCDKCPDGECQCSDSESQKGSQSSTEILTDDNEAEGSSRSPSNSRSASTSPKPKIAGRRVRNGLKGIVRGKKGFAGLKFPERSIMTRSNLCYRTPTKPVEEFEFSALKEDDKEYFLGTIGLTSKKNFESIKRKRNERKRRSVAGTNSMYNDYFQPIAPKRTYTPRKVTSSRPTSPVQVVVETAAEIEDDDEKQIKADSVCSICNESGSLEVCPSCSDSYHEKCLPTDGCPSCKAEASNISSIVGAVSVSDVSSSADVIKRYLPLGTATDVTLETLPKETSQGEEAKAPVPEESGEK